MLLLKRCRQAWKAWATIGAMVVGGVTMFWGLADLDHRIVVAMLAPLVTLGSLAIGCFIIRCPRCRLRLLWHHVSSGDHSTAFARFIRLQACPRCGFQGASSSGAA